MFQCLRHCVIKGHHWPVAQVLLGPGTAVVVVSACQGHPHGGEGGVDGDQWTEQHAEELHHQGKQVHQPVGKVSSGGFVAQTFHNECHEVPEWQWSIISDEVALSAPI